MSTSTIIAIVLGISPIIAIIFAVLYFKSKSKTKSLNQDLKTSTLHVSSLQNTLDRTKKESQVLQNDLKEQLQKLEKKVAPLWQYQHIEDTKALAQNIMDNAKQEVLVSREKAQRALDEAAAQAKRITDEARNNAAEIKSKATDTLEKACREADQIKDEARTSAQKVAGDALLAKENADLYEQTAKAMKNIIKGYGDEYLISSITLLDELAEEFDHKEAGQQLKQAREFSKTILKNNRAADCDYVEDNRKTTAINFILDAFNGKVDTALSKIKHDNYGKLEQEIKDSYALVNGLGKAFRDARITEEYLNSKLSELKWGVITKELQLQEKEEQRKIKEAMREEEKAHRDYERAIKEAEKEERLLQKAMVEARKHLAEASEEQRQQYEQQIAELQAKYEEAEARNQRAISMAQQTRRGHVYVISNIGSFGEEVYKIGLTRRLEPLDRVKELGDASVPFEFDVHAMIYSEDAPALENELHNCFERQRVNQVNFRKEFFNTPLSEIRKIVEHKNLDVHWTMKAEAKEYHESQSIIKRLQQELELPQQKQTHELEPALA